MTRILFTLLRMAVAFGLLAYLGLSGAIDWSALGGLAIAWPITLAALLILFVVIGVTSWRLCVLMRPLGLHLSLSSSVQLALMGNFFNACLPGATGGDMVKIYYATEGNRGRRTEVITIMILDRAVGMFALLVWPLLAAPFFLQMIGSMRLLHALLWIAAAFAAGMMFGVLICFIDRVKSIRLVDWALHRLAVGHYLERIFDTVRDYRRNVLTLIAAVAISLLAHTMTIGVVLLMAAATSPAGASWLMSILIPLGFLANTLPVTPGGLGLGEAAFSELFQMAGLMGGAEALLGWRMLTIFLSLFGLDSYLRGRKRLVHEQKPVLVREERAFEASGLAARAKRG